MHLLPSHFYGLCTLQYSVLWIWIVFSSLFPPFSSFFHALGEKKKKLLRQWSISVSSFGMRCSTQLFKILCCSNGGCFFFWDYFLCTISLKLIFLWKAAITKQHFAMETFSMGKSIFAYSWIFSVQLSSMKHFWLDWVFLIVTKVWCANTTLLCWTLHSGDQLSRWKTGTSTLDILFFFFFFLVSAERTCLQDQTE